MGKVKRGQGRPADSGVGREAVLATARRLVKEMPPARVTISLIAREAGVDPALVRYYFGDRSNLLFAVADSMLQEARRPAAGSLDPENALEQTIRRTAQFTNSTKHIHRLMVDELADAKTGDAGRKLGEMNKLAIDELARLMQDDHDETVREVDPLLLHVALLALFDFFVSAEPVIRHMAPEGTDMNELYKRYEDFAVDVVLNGLRKR